MSELEDHDLLASYARGHSETAFAALVQRHVNLVYSVAWRAAGNAHAADEITQAVFIILARKAGGISRKTILPGWLHQTTRLTAANYLRGEIRRQKREQEAYMQSTLNEPDPEVWPRIAPLLDDALAKLGERDRAALVLRFLENKSLREVGVALGASDDAAKMRINRALEKLRKMFAKRGATYSVVAIAGAVAAHSAHAAPTGLATVISAVAVTKGAAAGGTTLTLVKGALKIMAWTKAKTAVVVGASLLFAAGTTTITVKEIADRNDERIWRTPDIKGDVFERAAPQVTILPTKFPNGRNAQTASGNRWLGIDQPLASIFGYAYDWPYARIAFDAGNPKAAYDMIANLPQGSTQALQGELKKKLHLAGHPETRDMDVLLLKVKRPNAPGLKPPSGGDYSDPWGHFYCHNQRISTSHPSDFCLVMELELIFGKPVIDQTGLTQKFNIDLSWSEDVDLKSFGNPNVNHPALEQALLDQLGLELVSANLPVEMLVVDRVKA